MQVFQLPLLKYEKHRTRHHAKPHNDIPAQLLLQVEYRKDREYDQSNDFLNGLELRGAELFIAYSISRNLEAIFEGGNEPANQYRQSEG